MNAFYERLERMRPDVVLVDISSLTEPLEGMVGRIRAVTGLLAWRGKPHGKFRDWNTHMSCEGQ